MRKIYIITLSLLISLFVNAQCPTFSINAPNGTVVGCNPNSVPLNAINTSTFASVTYTWISMLTGTQTGASINATCPGPSNTFTVVASAPSSTCTSSQTITVSASTLVPNMTVSPFTRTITCNGACASFTAVSLSGTANIVGTWYNPDSSPITGPSLSPMLMCANAPGTYTAQFCSAISGCCTQQTVAVFGNTVIPTMTITPTTMNGFTINCTNPKVNMNINTSGTIAPLGYTWTPLSNPSASTTPATGGYTATVPGQYAATFHDGNFCYVSTTVNVSIDTLRPSPMAITDLPGNSFTINCYNPSLIATAVTNPMLPPSSYSWTQPGPLTTASNTALISMISIPGPSGSTATYTVSAMGANGCIGKQKVVFAKDTYTPAYSAVFTPSAITCSNPCIAMSPFGTSTVPITFTFTSPPPTQTATVPGALFCIPGTYTMTYMNNLNGCMGLATTAVPQNVAPPSTLTLSDFTLCASPTVIINGGATFTLSSYTYLWSGPGTISSPNNYNTAVNAVGVYTIFIQNSTNGCFTTNTANVVACTGITESLKDISVDIFPNPNTGKFYADFGMDAENAEMRIINSIGQEIAKFGLRKGRNEIDIKNLAKGIYVCTIFINNEAIGKTKIVIE